MKRRRTTKINILLFSIAALALGSVGFSTWIIGQIDANKQITANIEINGPTSKVFLGEISYTDPNKGLDVKFDSVGSEDLNVGLSSISTVVSENLISGHYDISFNEKTITRNEITPTIENGTNKDIFGRDNKKYNYLTFKNNDETLTSDKLTFKEIIDIEALKTAPYYQNTSFKEYKIDVSKLNISYGSYFEFKNPQTFYDEKLEVLKNTYLNAIDNKEEARSNYIKGLDQAVIELNNFVNNFNGQQIVIDIIGTYEFNDGGK